MRKKRFKQMISLTLTLLMLGATVLTGLPAGVSAASNEVTLLTNSGPHAGETYIDTYMKGSGYSSDATDIEISFKYNSLGTPTDEYGFNDTFEFVVFDSNWGGWDRTTIGPDGYDQTGAVTPEIDKVYTVKVPLGVIEGKLTTSYSVFGFNIQSGGIGNSSVTILSLKYIEKMPEASEPVIIEGSWHMTGASGDPCGTMSVISGTATVHPNNWNIQVENMNVADFTSPVVAVTVEYTNITGTIVPQSEILDSSYVPIVLNYPQVTKSGEVTYLTNIPKTMTSMFLAYDICTVKKIEIYDEAESQAVEKTGITNTDIITEMGAGWSLKPSVGNVWGVPTNASRRLFKIAKEAGFSTVKIPVTYIPAVTISGNNITVNQTTLNRILNQLDDIVQMAVDYDLMVVTETMYDGTEGILGSWIRVDQNSTYTNNMYTAFDTIWTSIANKLKKYDQHVIFQGMNDVGHLSNYGNPSDSMLGVINGLNQTFVEAVRSTGGNNLTRFLMVPGYHSNIDYTISNKFVMPKYNNSSDKIIVSAHFFDPYNFTINTGLGGTSTITQTDLITIATQFAKMKAKFTDNGIPVVIDEFYAINKGNYNAIETYINEIVVQAKEKGLGYIYVDDGNSGVNGTALWSPGTYGRTELGERLIPILTNTQ